MVLFAPGVYDAQAYDTPFNEEFSNIIRREGSWKDSDVFGALEKYHGNLLVFHGEDDQVIPPEMIEFLDKYSSKVARKEIRLLPNCGHAIHTHISQKEELMNAVVHKIAEFI